MLNSTCDMTKLSITNFNTLVFNTLHLLLTLVLLSSEFSFYLLKVASLLYILECFIGMDW